MVELMRVIVRVGMRRVVIGLAASLLLTTATVALPAGFTLPSASAATCYGAGCDGLGPQGAGCFDDDVVRAAVADGSGTRLVSLRYSASCHAFWAYGANAPDRGTAEISFEMQQKNDKGVWVTKNRFFAYLDAGEAADWTNALGARNSGSRFRAIYVKPNGASFFTDWVHGGTQ